MVGDSHTIWRFVANNYRSFEEVAPEGHEPVVEAFLFGRNEPFRIGQVQTSESLEWVFLMAAVEEAEDAAKASPDEHVVFVRHELVQRIELRYEPTDKPTLGFKHQLLGEAETSTKE